MIQKSNSLAIAQQVLSLIQFRIEQELADKLNLECYANGREQGFHIFGTIGQNDHQTAVSFAGCHVNDDIVVHFGNKAKFCPQGNYFESHLPPKSFKAGDFDAAAYYILELFGQARN